MDFKNITIIGVGLIGGSFALSLKKAGFAGTITGIGRREENLARAVSAGIIDHSTTDHAAGVRNADLVVLASSVGQFEKIARDIRSHLKRGAVVTDVGSVKAEIIKQLEPLMPPGVFFVGGHPIAGKECPGMEGAAADLFTDAQCVITPTAKTNGEAMGKVIDLWNIIGAKTVIMTPEQHDLIFAAVSHLPHVVSYALINTIIDIDKNILPHGGRGLRDLTRIALSPPDLWRDICAYNRSSILRTLRSFSSSISSMITLFEESDWPGLEKEFLRAKESRHLIETD
ncbi:MAG: prephenate dehydrogenase/arogenate dehydrogenase family protein [Nitrospiraceae bacterium]|nr:MAG: prephenate dehydrogenase/arogenate dehydrogenase family protein [Nitrospiraceae bacterium]